MKIDKSQIYANTEEIKKDLRIIEKIMDKRFQNEEVNMSKLNSNEIETLREIIDKIKTYNLLIYEEVEKIDRENIEKEFLDILNSVLKFEQKYMPKEYRFEKLKNIKIEKDNAEKWFPEILKLFKEEYEGKISKKLMQEMLKQFQNRISYEEAKILNYTEEEKRKIEEANSRIDAEKVILECISHACKSKEYVEIFKKAVKEKRIGKYIAKKGVRREPYF